MNIEPTFDQDGYPTADTEYQIRIWPAKDPVGWMNFVMRSWNTHYGSICRSVEKNETSFVTGGWSGNETLIDAMEDNYLLWHKLWRSSHRGGMYVFETPNVIRTGEVEDNVVASKSEVLDTINNNPELAESLGNTVESIKSRMIQPPAGSECDGLMKEHSRTEQALNAIANIEGDSFTGNIARTVLNWNRED